jgi:membrane protein implicated in regulation of membrane protease activity
MKLNKKPQRPTLQPDFGIEAHVADTTTVWVGRAAIVAGLSVGAFAGFVWGGPTWQLAVLLVLVGINSALAFVHGVLAARKTK